MVLTVHHLVASRSQRILWLLEELEVPYEVKIYERVGWGAPSSLKAVHPLGKSPIITDGDLTLPESGAIIDYIIRKYGQGRITLPTEGKALADELYYSHSAEASLMPLIVNKVFCTRIIPGQTPEEERPVVTDVLGKVAQTLYEPPIKIRIDEHLSKNKWFAGGEGPTVADYMMIFPLELLRQSGSSTPHIDAYIDRAQTRPAYRRALERGGPYRFDFQVSQVAR
uniref:glutathione transferase n=1 Tax=Schizophyllum commune (strain H4-8 / FGSC 9210) TaxID=578458 RepID=D8QI66_SCHCM